jgi:hypothetical protein
MESDKQLLDLTLIVRTLVMLLYGHPISQDNCEWMLDELAKIEDILVERRNVLMSAKNG